MTESLYSLVYHNIENGSLSPDFVFPDESGLGIHFAPGAMDGIYIYHMAQEPLEDAAYQGMADVLDAGAAGDYDEAERRLSEWTEEYRIITAADAMQNYIYEHREELDPLNLHGFAVYLMLESTHAECVKAGLVIAQMFTDLTEQEQDIVFTLGLCDEFTLYASWIMSHWEDGNQEIFELAKHTRGWGRIYAVNTLEPVNDEIREWLLKEGNRNTILPGYSAYACWEKSGAKKLLKPGIKEDDLKAVFALIKALVEDSPAVSITGLQNAEAVLETLLKLARDYELGIDEYTAVYLIRRWAEENGWTNICSLSDTLLNSPQCREAVSEAAEIGEAVDLARELNIPYQKALYARMKNSFEDACEYCGYLIEDPRYTKKVLDLFRRQIPLSELEHLPLDENSVESDYFMHYALCEVLGALEPLPLEGTDIVLAALKSAAGSDRFEAVKTLRAWVQICDLPLKQLSGELYEAVKEIHLDQNYAVFHHMTEPLLEGFTVFEDTFEEYLFEEEW